MAQQYIGALISLISKSDIRYQGILHSINPAEATVSLEKVRSLGTEGRKGNPAEEIPGNDNVYDFIVFRASDVKDLQIEAPAAAPTAPPPIDDPAIVGTAAPPTSAPPAAPSAPTGAPPAHSPQQHPQQPPFPQGPPGGGQFYPYPPPHQGYGFPGGPPGPFGYGHPPPHGNFGPPGPFGPPGGGFPGYGPPPPHQFGQGPPPHGHFPPPQQHQLPPQSSPSVASAAAPLSPPGATGAPLGATSPVAPAAAPVKKEEEKNVEPAKKDQKEVTPPIQTTTNGTVAKATGVPTPTPAPTAPAATSPAPTQPQPVKNDKPRSYANPGGVAPPQQQQQGAPQSQPRGPRRNHAPTTADVDQLAREVSKVQVNGSGSAPQEGRRRHENGVGGSVFGNRRGGPHPNANRRLHAYPDSSSAKLVPQQDFDFQSNNAGFDKKAALEDPPAETDEVIIPDQPKEAFYDKGKSFFDSISNQSAGPTGNMGSGVGGRLGETRFDRNAERSKNLDTFGEAGGQGGGYGGYRRGGRGRGRGGFRRGGGPLGVRDGL
ncbi:hypothetical protein T439DRAFT_383346 [Meredithblackwellia eburnea MCA 4105]